LTGPGARAGGFQAVKGKKLQGHFVEDNAEQNWEATERVAMRRTGKKPRGVEISKVE